MFGKRDVWRTDGRRTSELIINEFPSPSLEFLVLTSGCCRWCEGMAVDDMRAQKTNHPKKTFSGICCIYFLDDRLSLHNSSHYKSRSYVFIFRLQKKRMWFVQWKQQHHKENMWFLTRFQKSSKQQGGFSVPTKVQQGKSWVRRT